MSINFVKERMYISGVVLHSKAMQYDTILYRTCMQGGRATEGWIKCVKFCVDPLRPALSLRLPLSMVAMD